MAFLATVYTSPRPQSVKFRVLNGTASPWGAAASPEGRWWSYRLRRDGMVPSSVTKEQTMSPLRARMIEDMKLAGLAATTQEIYLQAVRSLAKHYNRSPELLAEEEVRRYLLDVRERNARGSFKTSHYGIQFFYRNTLDQDWALFKKRSGFPSRGGCRRRFPIPKCGAFSPRSPIRYTAAVSA